MESIYSFWDLNKAKTMRVAFYAFLFFLLPFSVASQDILIYGIVTDHKNQPLENVKVAESSRNNYVFTTSRGLFSVTTSTKANLRFTTNGFEAISIDVSSLDYDKEKGSYELSVKLVPIVDVYNYSLEDLMQIEIQSVSKKSEKLNEAPQTAIILTSEDIRVRGYTDLEQIFHDLPGFDISRGYGTEYSQIYQRGYRSNNTDRTLFLVDGIEQNDIWSGSAWIGKQYPLNNIDKIEVVYGPATTVYGPNAFVGAVNIVTKTVPDILKGNRYLGISSHTGYGTWNTLYTDLNLAAAFKEISFSLSGRIYHSNEMDLSKYDDWDYSTEPYTIDYYKQILGTESDAIAALAQSLDLEGYLNSSNLNGITPKYSNQTKDYFLNGRLGFSKFTLGFQTFSRNEGYGGWYTDRFELGPEHEASWIPKNSLFFAKYSDKLTNNLHISSITTFRQNTVDGESKELYYIGYFNQELDISGLTDDEGNILPENEQSVPYWWGAYYQSYSLQLRSEISLNYTITPKLNLIAGTEYRHGYIQGQYLVSEEEIPEETGYQESLLGGNHFVSNDIGLFSQFNYQPINNLFLVVGGRLDHNRIRKTGGYGYVFNPKFAIIYQYNSLVFKTIYSEAFKDADFWTKYGTTPGRLLNNPSLPPEKVRNIDVSMGYNVSNSLYLDVAAYHARYDGVVGTADVTFTDEEGNTVNTTQHQAIGSLVLAGVQSNAKIKVDDFAGYINYTFTYPYNTTEDNKVRIGDIASHQVNFGASYNIKNSTTFSLSCNWVGEKETGQSTTISSNPFDSIEPYFVINGAINQRIWKGISAQLSVFNILNTEYFHPGVRSANGSYYAARIPQYERNFMLKIMLDF